MAAPHYSARLKRAIHFFVVEDRIRRLCMRCGVIYENDGETVAWNAVNLATGEIVYFKDDDVVNPVQVEIEVIY